MASIDKAQKVIFELLKDIEEDTLNILRNSPVIILDEPTSSLDPVSKKQVKKMIDILGNNRTLIMITHDEDLISGFDRLIRFDKGKIIHDEMLN